MSASAGTERSASRLAGVGSEATARLRPRPDAVTVLTIYLVLLVGVPSDQRLAALGGAGAPSIIWAFGAGLCWCLLHLQRSTPTTTLAQPVRTAQYLLLGTVVASYAAAMLRPLPPLEGNQANIGLLRVLALAGVLLLACDGIPSWSRFEQLLRRTVWAGALLACLGLLQFLTGAALVDNTVLPGLTSAQDFSAVVARGDFIRSAGTAMSPLEYAAVLAMVLPLALTLALDDRRTQPALRWFPVALIGAALLLSGSRSGFLGLVVVAVVLFPFWSGTVRLCMAALGAAAMAAVFVLVPGMIGTLRYLFTDGTNDSGSRSRTGSYDLAGEFIANSPLFGRGFGTFLPTYRIADNQYVVLLIELGLVGTLIFLGLVGTAVVSGLVGRRRGATPLERQTGPALAASVCAGAVLALFFDEFSFPMAVGLLFLMIGTAGAYWRLVHQRATADPEG